MNYLDNCTIILNDITTLSYGYIPSQMQPTKGLSLSFLVSLPGLSLNSGFGHNTFDLLNCKERYIDSILCIQI